MDPIKLYWWRPKKGHKINLGDHISGNLVRSVSGRNVQWAGLTDCDMLAVGSILTFPLKKKIYPTRESPMHVWGSGLIGPIALGDKPKYIYASVRGPLTRCLVDPTCSLPVGDPGLLVSECWHAAPAKRHAWGIIPHHTQLGSPIYAKLLENAPNAVLIDFTKPEVAETLQTLSACENILSSSLHGLIIADSYKIPNYWHKTEAALHSGNNWKFFDYFSSVSRSTIDPVALPNNNNLNNIQPEDWEFAHFQRIDNLKARIAKCFPATFMA